MSLPSESLPSLSEELCSSSDSSESVIPSASASASELEPSEAGSPSDSTGSQPSVQIASPLEIASLQSDPLGLFVEIHSQHVKPDDLWKNLLDTAGLEKVHEHTDQLASVFDFVNLATARRAKVALRWSDFTAGETRSWKLLQKELGINEKDHVDRTETLIRRAYFVRFPERDASKLDGDQMLAEIDISTLDPHLKLLGPIQAPL
ncbi:hypothetical protein PtA15_3A387 [Puccinia triticina]|uniref:Uncharacterized protein n=1 Tax=Puccinia triticina TaxID=208348 RepID=A0ABY7CFU9_9BASI|nr:uncharacterized protein PtA15_3A387 [Puccinia triticina]WAQ83021.1 hypothetical protein PtA15_3A387 [Puccinia triticina]